MCVRSCGWLEGDPMLASSRCSPPQALRPLRGRDLGWKSGLSQMWGAQADSRHPHSPLYPRPIQQFPKGPSTSSETWTPLHLYVFFSFLKVFPFTSVFGSHNTHTGSHRLRERRGDSPGSQPQGQTAPGFHPCRALQVPSSSQSASLKRTF